MTIQFPASPVQGQIFNLTPEKKYQYNNGRWKIFTNNLPLTAESSSLQRPVHSEEAPASPSANKLWLKLPEMRLHYEYFDGENYSWIPAEPDEKLVNVTGNTLDLSAGTVFKKTVTGAISLLFSNPKPAGLVNSFILELTNGGAHAVTWNGVSWAGGTPPALTPAGVDILGFYSIDGGVSYRGFVLSKDSKPTGA